MNVSRAKTEDMCLNGTPYGSVKMRSAQLPRPRVTEFKYMGSTLQSDGDMIPTEVTNRTQCGYNNWSQMPGVL